MKTLIKLLKYTLIILAVNVSVLLWLRFGDVITGFLPIVFLLVVFLFVLYGLFQNFRTKQALKINETTKFYRTNN